MRREHSSFATLQGKIACAPVVALPQKGHVTIGMDAVMKSLIVSSRETNQVVQKSRSYIGWESSIW